MKKSFKLLSGSFMVLVILLSLSCGMVTAKQDKVPVSGITVNAVDPSAVLLFNDISDYCDVREDKARAEYIRLVNKYPFIENIFGQEEVLIDIELANTNTLFIKAIKNGTELEEFVMIQNTTGFDPTITVKTDEATVRDIINSPTNRSAFETGAKAFRDGDVDVNAKGWKNRLIQIIKRLIP